MKKLTLTVIASAIVGILAGGSIPLLPDWVGKWRGFHTAYGTNHPIELTVDDQSKITGTYKEPNDWEHGTLIGKVEKDGKFNFSLRFGKNAPWGQITGKFTPSVDGKTLTDENAVFRGSSEEPGKPGRKIKVFIERV